MNWTELNALQSLKSRQRETANAYLRLAVYLMLKVSIIRTHGLPQLNRLRNLSGVPHLHVNSPVAVKNTSSRKLPIVSEVNTRYPHTKDSRY